MEKIVLVLLALMASSMMPSLTSPRRGEHIPGGDAAPPRPVLEQQGAFPIEPGEATGRLTRLEPDPDRLAQSPRAGEPGFAQGGKARGQPALVPEEEARGHRLEQRLDRNRGGTDGAQRGGGIFAAFGKGRDIDADTDDQPVETPLADSLRLQQDAAHLAAIEEHIVGPFVGEL